MTFRHGSRFMSRGDDGWCGGATYCLLRVPAAQALRKQKTMQRLNATAWWVKLPTADKKGHEAGGTWVKTVYLYTFFCTLS